MKKHHNICQCKNNEHTKNKIYIKFENGEILTTTTYLCTYLVFFTNWFNLNGEVTNLLFIR